VPPDEHHESGRDHRIEGEIGEVGMGGERLDLPDGLVENPDGVAYGGHKEGDIDEHPGELSPPANRKDLTMMTTATPMDIAGHIRSLPPLGTMK
jgi:hypothetical protein